MKGGKHEIKWYALWSVPFYCTVVGLYLYLSLKKRSLWSSPSFLLLISRVNHIPSHEIWQGLVWDPKEGTQHMYEAGWTEGRRGSGFTNSFPAHSPFFLAHWQGCPRLWLARLSAWRIPIPRAVYGRIGVEETREECRLRYVRVMMMMMAACRAGTFERLLHEAVRFSYWQRKNCITRRKDAWNLSENVHVICQMLWLYENEPFYFGVQRSHLFWGETRMWGKSVKHACTKVHYCVHKTSKNKGISLEMRSPFSLPLFYGGAAIRHIFPHL